MSNSENMESHLLLGLEFMNSDPKQSIKHLNLALVLDPNSFEASYLLGMTHYQDEGYEKAIEYLTCCIKSCNEISNIRDVDILSRIAECHFILGENDIARQVTREIFEKDKYHPLGRFVSAGLQKRDREYNKKLEDLIFAMWGSLKMMSKIISDFSDKYDKINDLKNPAQIFGWALTDYLKGLTTKYIYTIRSVYRDKKPG